MKVKSLPAMSLISVMIFFAALSISVALRCTGPFQLLESLWVTSDQQHWLVFFDGISFEQVTRPFFGGTLALRNGDDSILGNGVHTKCTTDRTWHFWGDTYLVQRRYVDAKGVTQLATTDFRFPGVFYLHYKWLESRLLTFALRGWFFLGLCGLLPGIWCILWVNRRFRRTKIEKIDRKAEFDAMSRAP